MLLNVMHWLIILMRIVSTSISVARCWEFGAHWLV